MDHYRAILELLCKHDIAYQVVNSGPEHAAQLIGAIVRHSNKRVRVFANDMNGDISDAKGSTLVEDFKSAIARDVRIEVMLKGVPDSSSKLIEVLRDGVLSKPGNVIVKMAPEPFVTRMISDDVANYFTLGDDCRFRREFDPVRHLASGNMNDPTEVTMLGKVFDSYFAEAKPLMGE